VERLVRAYVAQASGFWKKLSQEHLTLPIHDARAQLWSDALVASGYRSISSWRNAAPRATRANRADGLELFPGALELVRGLREHGCKLGIVTNASPRRTTRRSTGSGCGRTSTACSSRTKCRWSTDPEIFRHVAARSQRAGAYGNGRRPVRSRHRRRRYRGALYGPDRHPRDPAARRRPSADAVVNSIADVLGVLPLGPPQGAPAGYRSGRLEARLALKEIAVQVPTVENMFARAWDCSRRTG